MTHPTQAYKILTPPQALAFESQGAFAGSPLDLADGYIHLSGADTLLGTLDKWYADAPQVDVIEIDLSSYGEALKWEPSRDGALFPHVYGVLALSTVTRRWTLSPKPSGGYALPIDLEGQ